MCVVVGAAVLSCAGFFTTRGAPGRGEVKRGEAADPMKLPRWLSTRGKDFQCLPREPRRVAHVANSLFCVVLFFSDFAFLLFPTTKHSAETWRPLCAYCCYSSLSITKSNARDGLLYSVALLCVGRGSARLEDLLLCCSAGYPLPQHSKHSTTQQQQTSSSVW